MPEVETPPPEGDTGVGEGQQPKNESAVENEGGGDKLLAGKYKTVEDLEKSYIELQKKLGQKAQPKPDAKQDDPLAITPDAPEVPDDAGIDSVVVRAGLDIAELTESWEKDGKLSDEQYRAFRKVNSGYTRKVVDDFIRGQQAVAMLYNQQVDKATKEAEKVVGGADQLQNLREWAKSNVDKGRLERLNKMLKGDPGFYPEYIRLLAEDHRQAVGAGKANPLIADGSAAASGAAGFSSHSEMMKAMEKIKAEGKKWSDDKAFMARLQKTPRHIQTGV